MPDLNRVPGFRSALEILADVVVKTEFAILDQQHDARGNELLAYGADPVIFVLLLARYYLEGLVPAIAASEDYGKQRHHLIMRFIAMHIWIPYFVVSDRVKRTFVR